MSETHLENQSSFLDQLPEDLRNEPSLKDFKDVASLAKTVVHQSKMIGGSVRIPSEQATAEDVQKFIEKVTAARPELAKLPSNEEELKAFRRRLGAPESADQYKIELPEELQAIADEETAKPILEMALEMGLSNDQAKILAEKSLRGKQESIAAKAAEIAANEAKLKEIWGKDYENRLEGVKLAARNLSEKVPDFAKFLESDAAKKPEVALMLAEIAKGMREGNAVLGKPVVKFGPTPDEARRGLDDLRNHPGYYNNMHPEHDTLMKEKDRLLKSL